MKEIILNKACEIFFKYGFKNITMDDIANKLSISKKTIYKHFETKETLVVACVLYLLESFSKEVADLEISNKDPLERIILIYKKSFEYLKYLKPSFLDGLKRHYPRAFDLIEKYKINLVTEIIYKLLNDAKNSGFIKEDVNLELMCEIYFSRLYNIVFTDRNLFDDNSEEDILQYLIINNLRGIVNAGYANQFIEK
ncbi:MAG: TetR/AcrR family transcriptional regulator [Flavobacteriaceae bacterium]|nr:TetR/AcrR family transcriptional regulator [Flavobacteriaceae bacterium]